MLIEYQIYINKYLLFLGIGFVIYAVIEIFFHNTILNIWIKWIEGKYFLLYGGVLIVFGFPLTVYNGYLSSIIFYVGLFVVLMGPFILIYPEKMRDIFLKTLKDIDIKERKKYIYVDAFVRVCMGILFTTGSLLS